MNTVNSSYMELLIKINPKMEDIVSEICFENLPCEGIILAEETYKDLKMISTTEGTLKVFLNCSCEHISEIDIKNFLDTQRELLKSRGYSDEDLGSWEFEINIKDNQDWSKKWKEKWDVTHVTDRITVVPDWIEYLPNTENEIILKIEPSCAFGTGTHATTQLCMRAMENFLKKGNKVADIGTGSGILSVCAKKFGAGYVYGCDNDETVIDVAKENALKNGVECTFELNTADKLTEQFDFVMANILHNVLVEIMPDLKKILKPDGILVLSGILDEKAPIVINAVNKCKLRIIKQDKINQWVGLTVKGDKLCQQQ